MVHGGTQNVGGAPRGVLLSKVENSPPGRAYRLAVPETVQLRSCNTFFTLAIANIRTHGMRIHEHFKPAAYRYTKNHASEVTAASGGTHEHGNVDHEQQHGGGGHAGPKIMQIRQHAPTCGHPTDHDYRYRHTSPVDRDLAPSLLADDGARAARGRGSIGELSGARLALGLRLAGERLRFEAYRSSSRPPSSFRKRLRESTKSL